MVPKHAELFMTRSGLFLLGAFMAFAFFFPCETAEAEPGTGASLRQMYDNTDKVTFFKQFTQAHVVGEAEGKAYAKLAQKMAYSSSSPGQKLEERWREPLRDTFGTLVDDVSIYWNAPLEKEWKSPNYTIKLKGAELDAQTFGPDIYFDAAEGELSGKEFVLLLIHHLVHVKQFTEHHDRSYKKFGKQYFKDYLDAFEVYEDNEMEQTAQKQVDALEPALQFVVSIENTTSAPITVYYSWTNTGRDKWRSEKIVPDEPSILTDDEHSICYIRLVKKKPVPGWKLEARPFFGDHEPESEDGEQYVFQKGDDILDLKKANTVQAAGPLVLVKK